VVFSAIYDSSVYLTLSLLYNTSRLSGGITKAYTQRIIELMFSAFLPSRLRSRPLSYPINSAHNVRPRGIRHFGFHIDARHILRDRKANGPKTSLPAQLILPTRRPVEGILGYRYRLGKTYLEFYKLGIKNVFGNFKAARSIQNSINVNHGRKIEKAIDAHDLTRQDFLALTRSSRDIRKIPLFIVIVMITGEFSPLILPFLGGLVPGPCRMPSQVIRIRKRLQARRRDLLESLPPQAPESGVMGGLDTLDRAQLRLVSASLGLYSRHWDRLEPIHFPPKFWLKRSIRKSVAYLDMDDMLLERSGGVVQLEVEEIKIALVERGMDVEGKTNSELRMNLWCWMTSPKGSIQKLLLQRFENIYIQYYVETLTYRNTVVQLSLWELLMRLEQLRRGYALRNFRHERSKET
jgi:hypothetical protein